MVGFLQLYYGRNNCRADYVDDRFPNSNLSNTHETKS